MTTNVQLPALTREQANAAVRKLARLCAELETTGADPRSLHAARRRHLEAMAAAHAVREPAPPSGLAKRETG